MQANLPINNILIYQQTNLQSCKSTMFVYLLYTQISNLEKLGYTNMTSVQFETIPKLVDGHDLMVKSQTGSGNCKLFFNFLYKTET